MADILAGASGVSSQIGRYFTVVSALPPAAFTAYVYVLVRTCAWGGVGQLGPGRHVPAE